MKYLAKVFVTMSLLCYTNYVNAQQQKESFDEFRKSILNNYDRHRSQILSQYGKYLDSLWVAYPQHKGVVRNPFPKPADVPTVKDAKPKPKRDVSPIPDRTPVIGDTPDPKQTRPNLPNNENAIDISFFGIPLTMTDIDYTIPDRLTRSNVSDLWSYMYDNVKIDNIIDEIQNIGKKLNLNDYLTFELIRDYVEAKFPDHTKFTKAAMTHFLLANMGYDARLAETESGMPLILIPFNQMVYARQFLIIDNRKYFVFSDAPIDQNESVYSCLLPSDLYLGNTFELKLNNLRLPYRPYKYRISFGDILLQGEINENIYPILYHYPQIPFSDYAQSSVSSEMRNDIVSQLQAALKSYNKKEKAEKLLHFTQYAFDYATDDENHGFEKPYFFEEMVYYPKCDCEDRSIFYSYLLYHVAGIENLIISYPGHAATAINLPEYKLQGTSYMYDGKEFYISDPTYIGASTGMCMPQFESVNPTIEYIYK